MFRIKYHYRYHTSSLLLSRHYTIPSNMDSKNSFCSIKKPPYIINVERMFGILPLPFFLHLSTNTLKDL